MFARGKCCDIAFQYSKLPNAYKYREILKLEYVLLNVLYGIQRNEYIFNNI